MEKPNLVDQPTEQQVAVQTQYIGSLQTDIRNLEGQISQTSTELLALKLKETLKGLTEELGTQENVLRILQRGYPAISLPWGKKTGWLEDPRPVKHPFRWSVGMVLFWLASDGAAWYLFSQSNYQHGSTETGIWFGIGLGWLISGALIVYLETEDLFKRCLDSLRSRGIDPMMEVDPIFLRAPLTDQLGQAYMRANGSRLFKEVKVAANKTAFKSKKADPETVLYGWYAGINFKVS